MGLNPSCIPSLIWELFFPFGTVYTVYTDCGAASTVLTVCTCWNIYNQYMIVVYLASSLVFKMMWIRGAYIRCGIYPSGRGCLFPFGVKQEQPIVTDSTPHLGKCRGVRGPHRCSKIWVQDFRQT
jgi:hypothetical protein